MDRLPLVPKNEKDHDILPLTTEIFQEIFQTQQYPKNVAENYRKYVVDVDFKEFRETGLTTVKILQALDTCVDNIANVEKEIMENHALVLIEKYKNTPLYGELSLKRVSLLQKLSNCAVHTYGLIEKKDIHPNVVEQYLDFTYNPSLHTCNSCPSPNVKTVVPTVSRKKYRKPKQTEPTAAPLFQLEPDKVIFYNYELGRIYKDKFKLRNISKTLQHFFYYGFPKESQFRLKMLTDCCKLAPGMCAEFLVTFQAQAYKHCQEHVKFKTANGMELRVTVLNVREPPILECYILYPLLPWHTVQKAAPGSQYFSERRRSACNFSIDCGTCLLGSYSLITVTMKNNGQKGRFVIATENEWCFNELNDSSTRFMELTQGPFTVFPTYFEIDEGEVGQLFVYFVPENKEFYAEKLFMICDNYSHQEIELLADCVMFGGNFLKVNMYIVEDTFSYFEPVMNTTLAPFESSSFEFSVINESPINFEYFWALKANKEDGASSTKMDPAWIEILHSTKFLPSFSITDVVIKLTAQTEQEGSYYIYLSLYLKNVPIKSIRHDAFIVQNKGQVVTPPTCDYSCTPLEETRSEILDMSNKLADVHIFQLGLICDVKIPQFPPRRTIPMSVEQITKISPKLTFSKIVLNFGLIPKGYQTSKHVYITNLTEDETDWCLIEMDGESDIFHISPKRINVSETKGTLRKKHRQKISYTLQAEECVRRVNILVLFSAPFCTCHEYVMESICLVAYEVAEIQISLYTENNKAILCPKEFIYVGISSVHTVYVHNSGILIGCFYFLKPIGTHADKVRLKFNPQSGLVQPGATTEVKVQLVALESGIFDNIRVPCFIGDCEQLIFLKVLCTVATTNLYFYLPNNDRGYNRVLWPPKTDQPCWENETGGDSQHVIGEGEWVPTTRTPSVDPSLLELIAPDSVATTYPTIKVKNIQIKQKTKLTLYMENLTPIHGHFTVNPTNYTPENDCLSHILVKAKTRTPEFFWDKACMDGCGIVIEPERSSGDLVGYEVLEIHLWIYANTWGKYLEEMMVEVNDLTPFCFNLLLEVVGLPIEFPFARNTLLPHPTIRFENVAYMSENNVRGFTVTNISAVPVEVNWHLFTCVHDDHLVPFNIILEFDEDTPRLGMPRKFYGCEACSKCISISPCSFVIEKQSTVTLSVTIGTDGFVPHFDKTHLKYELLGFISVQNCDKFKENYYKREGGMNSVCAKIEVLATLELPIMQVDLSSDETTMDIFVNDILLCNYKFPEVYLLLRNVDMSVINFKIDIEKPFLIIGARTIPSGITDTENLTLERNECLQVMITCDFSCEDLMQYAELIYQHDDSEGIDKTENFTSVISKSMNVYQQGASRQMIPFVVRLHYPHIVVKPTFLTFSHCLLYRTKKTTFTIYNMTGSLIKYEIFKTTNHDDFEVHPNFGEIPRSTGLNHQFVDIAVYFTPRHCKLYLESLRIFTNIPQYYVDIPMSGNGSNDEKFNV